jgi:hypothetical protein
MHRSDWLLGEVEGRRGRERLDKLDCRGCEPSKGRSYKYEDMKDERGDVIKRASAGRSGVIL